MSVGPHLFARRPGPRQRTHLPRALADRRSVLANVVRREWVLSVCLVVVALHLAAAAPGSTAACPSSLAASTAIRRLSEVARPCMCVGPPTISRLAITAAVVLLARQVGARGDE